MISFDEYCKTATYFRVGALSCVCLWICYFEMDVRFAY